MRKIIKSKLSYFLLSLNCSCLVAISLLISLSHFFSFSLELEDSILETKGDTLFA